MSLTVGLTIGFAAAGAAGGALFGGVAKVGDLMLGTTHIFMGSRPPQTKIPSLAAFALVGGLAGGVAGFAGGEGYEYLTNDPEQDRTTVIVNCAENTPADKKMVISKDAIGNPICSYE